MDISKIKKDELELEHEEYLKKEQVERENDWQETSRKKNFSNETFDNVLLQQEYEEYIQSELASSEKKLQKIRLKKVLVILFGLIFLLIFSYASFVAIRLYKTSKTISASPSSFAQDFKSTAMSLVPSQRKELLGEKEGRINILLLGAAGEKNPGKNLTDTIMVASINTKSKKIALLSLPRDMYVEIPASTVGGPTSTVGGPNSNSFTKINGLYQYGLRNNLGADAIKKSVETITGLSIQYYLAVDFDGFIKFIDSLGGINVTVERDIYDARYPGPNYSYQIFELKKGLQKLDGETALKYVRERHDDPQGDFGRAKRQQQVMQSAKNKAFSIKTILNPVRINELLSNLEKNIRTNLRLDDMESLIALSKELDTQNISTKVVDAWNKDSLLKVSHVFYGETRAFVLVPRAGNYSQIQELSQNIFNLEKIEKRKAEIEKEDARILIVNMSGDKTLPQKIKTLLSESLKIKNIEHSPISGPEKTQQTEVFDLTNKEKIFTLDEIIKSVPAQLSNKNDYDDFKKNDFVLVLGKDIVDAYKFEEDDVEQFRNAQDVQEYFEINNSTNY